MEERTAEEYEGLAEIDGSVEVLRMKMDAMMWAAKAKDAELAALQACVREGRERERRLEAELAGIALRLERAELAEERLAAEIAELEAEAFERARTHKFQLDSLNASLREKDKLLANAAGQLNLLSNGKGKHVDDVERVSKKVQGTPPRRSPARYPRSPARATPAVKLSSSWWPWARRSNPESTLPQPPPTTPRTPPRIAKLPKHLLSSTPLSSSSSSLHTPLTIS